MSDLKNILRKLFVFSDNLRDYVLNDMNILISDSQRIGKYLGTNRVLSVESSSKITHRYNISALLKVVIAYDTSCVNIINQGGIAHLTKFIIYFYII